LAPLVLLLEVFELVDEVFAPLVLLVDDWSAPGDEPLELLLELVCANATEPRNRAAPAPRIIIFLFTAISCCREEPTSNSSWRVSVPAPDHSLIGSGRRTRG
jgi:hypothetical protein